MNSEQEREEISNLLMRFREQVEQKASDPYAVIQQIQEWTTHQTSLTRILCSLVLEHPSPIPQGQEAQTVRQIVQTQIIKNWENNRAADHLKSVGQRVLNDEKSARLLRLYARMLQEDGISANGSQEQQQLLDLGFAKKEQRKLKVANPIYTAVFNLEWVAQQLPNALHELAIPGADLSEDRDRATRSAKTWSGIALLLTLAVAVAYPLIPKPTSQLSTSPNTGVLPQSSDLTELCESNTKDLEAQLNRLTELKQQAGGKLPSTCQLKLDDLLYRVGMKKARGDGSNSGDFSEGVRKLCQISEGSSDAFISARSQLNAWYNNQKNPEFKELIVNYLNALKEEDRTCPAAKDISI